MQLIKYILLFHVFSILSCKIPVEELEVLNNKRAIYLKEYSNEPICFQQCFFIHDSIHQFKVNRSLKGKDSVLNLVKIGLEKLPIKLYIDSTLRILENDNLFENINRTILRIRNIDDSTIISYAKDTSIVEIIPIIYTVLARNFSGSAGYTVSGSWWGYDDARILIYLIKDRSVIYKKYVRYSASHINHHGNDTFWISRMKPEYWDLVLQKAMEDYIKRIKK